MLPEVRNRPFLPRENFKFEPSKNGCESNRGTLRFTISISDILMAPSCSLRSFLEVGVSWAASRYSFRNLRFKHRGIHRGMWWVDVSCTIAYLIAYPYAWTVNFGNCVDVLLTTLVHKWVKSPPPTSLSSFSLVLWVIVRVVCVSQKLGVETERSGDPHWESKPSTQHPHRTHRTHDTTDQWRDGFLWLGRK